VQEGIRLFAPDIVDVSSGVEGTAGKDRDLIIEFIRKAREYE
jgi:phosphoribosylanthranilate isomerase